MLLELLATATSPLKADRTLRTIEDRFTPIELKRALPVLDGMKGVARAACERSEILKLLREEAPQPFARTELAADAVLYSAPGGAKADKSLVVAFCGRSHRLMTPWSIFLQMIPAAGFDVLILADRSNNHFFNGVGGYAADLYGLVQRVRRDTKAVAYRRLYCFGTSTGGLPALRFGILAGAYRSISVGGQMVWHIHRLKTGGAGALQAFDPLCACDWPQRGHLVCIHAEELSLDYYFARQLQTTLGASRVPIAGTGEHNVIYQIFKSGNLRKFYGQLFDFAP